MRILADADLPALAQAFPQYFDIVTFDNQKDLNRKIQSADILICRSTLNVDDKLIDNTPIKLVATATSGINHIDTHYLAKNNIPLVTAKGANAGAVSDWALSVMAHIKSKLRGNCIGIIGVGHVGSLVTKWLSFLNYQILTCDPIRNGQPNFVHSSLNKLVHCDALFIHANLHDNLPCPTHNLINQAFLNKLNPRCFIINASRGGIVNENELLNSNFSYQYCTDVFTNEPNISEEIINNAFICTPHIAGHTIEAKINAVFQVSVEIHHFCNKPAPTIALNNPSKLVNLSSPSWPYFILKQYDPITETNTLKMAGNKKETFFELRKAHHRHGLRLLDS